MATHHSRRHTEARAKVDRERDYQPAEAIALVKGLSSAKFDESVEVHIRTGLNVRHADEQLRGTIALPNGLGRDVKVAVFAQGAKAVEAEAGRRRRRRRGGPRASGFRRRASTSSTWRSPPPT